MAIYIVMQRQFVGIEKSSTNSQQGRKAAGLLQSELKEYRNGLRKVPKASNANGFFLAATVRIISLFNN